MPRSTYCLTSRTPPALTPMLRLPIALVLTLAATMLLVGYLDVGPRLLIPGRGFIAAGLFALGLTIIGVCGYAFRRSNTTVNPLTPEESSRLVTTGLYRYSRNPMYVGFLLWLLACAVLVAHLVTFLLLPVFVIQANRLYILPEETALKKTFGADYLEYAQQVRRWL